MKKLILVLFIFLITGCFEDSGVLVKSCVLENNNDVLVNKTTYTFTFKQDIIEDLKVLNEYYSENKNTISSIKLSMGIQNNSLDEKITYNIISDLDNEYKVEYNLPIEENLTDKFVIYEKRSELVKELKKKGFVCE